MIVEENHAPAELNILAMDFPVTLLLIEMVMVFPPQIEMKYRIAEDWIILNDF